MWSVRVSTVNFEPVDQFAGLEATFDLIFTLLTLISSIQ
jgi:hypothetical protein